MARMTASDFLTEMRLSLGGETTETLTDNQLLRWLNRGYIDVASAYHPVELETTTTITTSSGTAEYVMFSTGSDDTLEILSVIDDTTNVLLYPWSSWQYDRAVQGNSSTITGTPVYWYESGAGSNNRKNLTFYPTPSSTLTLTVKYIKKPTELVTTPSPTSAVLKEPWDEVILYRAISKGWRTLGDDDKAYKWELTANNSAKNAAASGPSASYVPFTSGSIVGGALQ